MSVGLNNNPVSVSSHPLPSRLTYSPSRKNRIALESCTNKTAGPRHLAVAPAIKGAATIKEGLLDLRTSYALNIEVLASSVGAFATFASMDKVFAHHKGTLPATYTAQGPPSRRTSTSRSRPFAHCVTSGPIPPSPAVGFCPPGGSEWGRHSYCQGAVVGTVANGGNATSGGRAEAYPRIVRPAPGAPTWPPAPAARTLDLRVHFASAIEARWPPLAGPVLSAQM
ncbi:hypothetical protein C8J57DRAFT_1520673 [Mycena rebaudengoi]|nr:hypothetical protein C8J57DRAFT_1520673 [Mycena rebaudengoi]